MRSGDPQRVGAGAFLLELHPAKAEIVHTILHLRRQAADDIVFLVIAPKGSGQARRGNHGQGGQQSGLRRRGIGDIARLDVEAVTHQIHRQHFAVAIEQVRARTRDQLAGRPRAVQP